MGQTKNSKIDKQTIRKQSNHKVINVQKPNRKPTIKHIYNSLKSEDDITFKNCNLYSTKDWVNTKTHTYIYQGQSTETVTRISDGQTDLVSD